MLHFLLRHPGRLMTKEELLDAVWPETHVGEGVLKVAIAELRKALHDHTRQPLYIETAHRRGYRFVGLIEEAGGGTGPRGSRALEREPELARLDGWLARALEGERQIVFITGETGIGKTTLLEAFVERASTNPALWTAHGQCLEQFGEGEPYMPVLEAFTRLCREPGRESLPALLRRHAPTWLAQMPSLIPAADREPLAREVLGSARERMLREVAEAIEALTAETPLLLVLEDLHWCDYATVDVIGYLARRRGPARLMVVGTYRPAEVVVKQHPLGALKRELQVRGQCAEVALELLSERAVADYLKLRFPGAQFPRELAQLVYARTDGNPLFVVNVADYLVAQKQVIHQPAADGSGERWVLGVPLDQVELGIPEDLQQLIERQLEMLSAEEQDLLVRASVAGLEFSTRTLAGAGLGDIRTLETRCQQLVRRRQFLRPAATITLHDRSLLERYGFIHGLFQHALYRRVPEPRRVLLHRALGEFQEKAYAAHLREISAELATHFEQGRDYERAVRYRLLSADNATRRYANREAIDHLSRALELVALLPAAQRPETEIMILARRAAARRTMDENDAAVEDLERAAQSAAAAGRVDWQVRVLLQLSSVLFWTDHQRSLAAAETAVERSRGQADQWLHTQARGYCASRRIRLRGWTGEDFREVLAARDAARTAGDREYFGLHTMSCAFFHSYRSEAQEACRAADQGMEIGLETGDAFLYMSCQYFKAWALLHSGEWGRALELVREGLRLSRQNRHVTGETVLRMIEARMHLEAGDYRRAYDLAVETVPLARPGFPEFVTRIVLGEAQAGLREDRAALETLVGVLRVSREGPFHLDWVFQLPLYRGMAELWLARGDLVEAGRAAASLVELAAGPGERNYLAQGRNLLARIALARGDLAEAQSHLAEAMNTLAEGKGVLAEWRVSTTAAEVSERAGRQSEAAAYRTKSAAILAQIAATMHADEPLRRAFSALAAEQMEPKVGRNPSGERSFPAVG